MRGSIDPGRLFPPTTYYFNSRLYMRGSPAHNPGLFSARKFQFTPLHERQRPRQNSDRSATLFQFTPLHERQRRGSSTAKAVKHFNSRLYMRGSGCAASLSGIYWKFQFTPLHERQLQKYTIFSIKSTQFSTKPCFFIVTSRKVVLFSIPVQYFL